MRVHKTNSFFVGFVFRHDSLDIFEHCYFDFMLVYDHIFQRILFICNSIILFSILKWLSLSYLRFDLGFTAFIA
jgi:hypothetical protein